MLLFFYRYNAVVHMNSLSNGAVTNKNVPYSFLVCMYCVYHFGFNLRHQKFSFIPAQTRTLTTCKL